MNLVAGLCAGCKTRYNFGSEGNLASAGLQSSNYQIITCVLFSKELCVKFLEMVFNVTMNIFLYTILNRSGIDSSLCRKLLPTGMEIPSSFEQAGHIAHLNLRAPGWMMGLDFCRGPPIWDSIITPGISF
jgi:hypothetical protein